MDFDRINDQEVLYRGVNKNNPYMWNDTENRPSSAVFKDSFGCSVDRDGEREEQIIVDKLRENLHIELRAIVHFSAVLCIHNDIEMIPNPIKSNDFHAILKRNPDTPKLSKKQAGELARNCQVISL